MFRKAHSKRQWKTSE